MRFRVGCALDKWLPVGHTGVCIQRLPFHAGADLQAVEFVQPAFAELTGAVEIRSAIIPLTNPHGAAKLAP
jgi:hypothetical protein